LKIVLNNTKSASINNFVILLIVVVINGQDLISDQMIA
jgi:hypothetical protein